MLNNKKTIFMGIALFAMFLFTHVFQNETQAQEDPLVVADSGPSPTEGATNQQGREILALLSDIKSVQLDESIFSDPRFQSLQDTSVDLKPEAKGRTNPFAPLGKDIFIDQDQGFATTGPRDIAFSSASTTDTVKRSLGKSPTDSPEVIKIPIGS